MPHKCGYFDHRAPRRATCCMNYGPDWMLDAQAQLIPGTSGRVGNEMCGRHLKEVRRVQPSEGQGERRRQQPCEACGSRSARCGKCSPPLREAQDDAVRPRSTTVTAARGG
jgi:hypothetical protein